MQWPLFAAVHQKVVLGIFQPDFQHQLFLKAQAPQPLHLSSFFSTRLQEQALHFQESFYGQKD